MIASLGVPVLQLPGLAATASDGPWSGAETTLRFAVPVGLLLVGALVFLWGRTQRQEVLDIDSRGGFAGPAGGGDDGATEGLSIEEGEARLRLAGQRVLAGLLLLLLGSLLLMAVIVWRLVS